MVVYATMQWRRSVPDNAAKDHIASSYIVSSGESRFIRSFGTCLLGEKVA